MIPQQPENKLLPTYYQFAMSSIYFISFYNKTVIKPLMSLSTNVSNEKQIVIWIKCVYPISKLITNPEKKFKQSLYNSLKKPRKAQQQIHFQQIQHFKKRLNKKHKCVNHVTSSKYCVTHPLENVRTFASSK